MIASKSVTNIVSIDHPWVLFLIHHLSYHHHVWIHCIQNSIYTYCHVLGHVCIFMAPCSLLKRSIDWNTTMYSSGMISSKSAPRRGAAAATTIGITDYKALYGLYQDGQIWVVTGVSSGVFATVVMSKKLRNTQAFITIKVSPDQAREIISLLPR